MHLERRAETSRALQWGAPFVAVGFTLLVAAALVAWAGAPVGRAYWLLLEGGFGSRFAWTETLTRATPLILTGLAAAVAFRARLFNIGAEGQLYAGALAAVAVGGVHAGINDGAAMLVMTTAALLRHGPVFVGVLRDGAERWFEDNDYDSVEQAKGSMSRVSVPDPDQYERSNYLQVLRRAQRRFTP
jgi:ABC-type uncharacterized transport system permease subunit